MFSYCEEFPELMGNNDEGKDKMNKPSCSMISAELGSCDFIENKEVLNGKGVMEVLPLVERTIN